MFGIDSIKTINEVEDSSKTISDTHSQIEDHEKLRSLQGVPIGLSPVRLNGVVGFGSGSSKRSKYAKSTTSSAVVPHMPEVTIQAPTPAKGAQKSEERNDQPSSTKSKSKRMNYAKKAWASTPVDNLISSSIDRFSKGVPVQFDTGYMGHSSNNIMMDGNRRNSPPPGMPEGRLCDQLW